MTYRGVADGLFRNEGGGQFSDASVSSGIARGTGKGLGVVSADLDNDGWPDLFVANDGEKNNLWMGSEVQRFDDQALMMGVAYNGFGKPEASMGIALGDVNADQRLDLFVTHLVRETNTLYTGRIGGMQDSTASSGTGVDSVPYTGFGTAFLDADNDGDLDLAVANGRVTRRETGSVSNSSPGNPIEASYGETNLFYLNDGSGHLGNACSSAGDFCADARLSRGLAAADIDADGDLDIVLSNGHGPVQLFRNDIAGDSNWLKVRAIDPALNRDAIGAVVELRLQESRMIRPVSHCYSYLTSSEATTHFGLGSAAVVDAIRMTWPDGSIELFPGVAANQLTVVERGTGESVP